MTKYEIDKYIHSINEILKKAGVDFYYNATTKEITLTDSNNTFAILQVYLYQESFIYELRKENEELKAQIKKMKSCSNCKHYKPDNDCEFKCYEKYEKWECKE